jgi:hypothetical protein
VFLDQSRETASPATLATMVGDFHSIVLQFARGDRSLIHETQNQVSCDAFDLALLLDEPACLWIPDSARTIGMNIGRDNTV